MEGEIQRCGQQTETNLGETSPTTARGGASLRGFYGLHQSQRDSTAECITVCELNLTHGRSIEAQ
ncbi:MAG: hypothetical protein VYD85_08615, partial [Pseudomonadota bacterium]|nr:hypothetical protein [Pseudomonadota bacterium]